jgi:hypothetical protein
MQAAVAALANPGPVADREQHVQLVIRQPPGDGGEVSQ